MRTPLIVLPFFWLSSVLLAQDSGWSETRFHRVHLRNGNFLDGALVQDTPTLVVLKVSAGEIMIRKDQIARDDEGRYRVEFMKMRSFREAPPLVQLRAHLGRR